MSSFMPKRALVVLAMVAAAASQSCKSDSDCSMGKTCEGFRCQTPLSLGETCGFMSGGFCKGRDDHTAICSSDNICTQVSDGMSSAGGACWNDKQCNQGGCNNIFGGWTTRGTCDTSLKKNGETCSSDNECYYASYCDAATCVARKADGEVCQQNFECDRKASSCVSGKCKNLGEHVGEVLTAVATGIGIVFIVVPTVIGILVCICIAVCIYCCIKNNREKTVIVQQPVAAQPIQVAAAPVVQAVPAQQV